MTVTECNESMGARFGQITRRINWTEEEYGFAFSEYPRHGYSMVDFLETIVEKYNPSGREIVYGWIPLLRQIERPGSGGSFTITKTEPT